MDFIPLPKISFSRFLIVGIAFFLTNFFPSSKSQSQWYEKESKHFRVVYRESHSYLVEHILQSGELALYRLHTLFRYTPGEKIVINTYDVNDYGAASATSVPRNYIWLDLAPIEPGYENIPYSERIRWLLTHELVHIVVNDLATNTESFNRAVFSKVAPEQIEPLSIFYSILTNFSRYTPRWHQEGIAVFLETWLSGGFGRALGSFDEMYFRSLVDEGKKFPDDIALETILPHRSFLVETNYYLYGGRFAMYLAKKFDPDKLLAWYTAFPSDFYLTFTTKFKNVFGADFEEVWDEFARAEKTFQEENLSVLRAFPLTPYRAISSVPIGSVSQPHLDAAGATVYWGEHRPHFLGDIQRFNLKTLESRQISTLPTPSLYQVSSTAFDAASNLFFYTTNNNQLYRDIYVLDVRTESKKLLFEDCRTGHLTVSSATHELWGIRHSGGLSILVYSPAPYGSLKELVHFDFGDEVQGLAVSPGGTTLAVVLHKANGSQTIVLVDTELLKKEQQIKYALLTENGSPENPSWTPDGKTLFWNAYTNGVSNIYRADIQIRTAEAVSHTLRGFFKPLYLSKDSLFAFEFSTDGFIPVILPNATAEHLPAIEYLGQQVVDKSPWLSKLALMPSQPSPKYRDTIPAEEYNGFNHLNVVSFIPVLTGFQRKKVLGIFAHISDPILNHDAIIEAGVSPFGEGGRPTQFHLKLKYDYQKEYEFGWDFNGPNFYDLFNKRKQGALGSRIRFGNTHYWVYDNPHKVKQLSEIALYTGVQFISDNIVPVSQPDFFVAQTSISSQYLRRTIGSSDFESGNEFAASLLLFGSHPKKNSELGFQAWAEWDYYSIFAAQHNVVHFKLAAGYHGITNNLLQSRFYFGGFGNRAVENVDVKQFRKVFRFPGIPVFSLGADRFGKVMIENNFPPIRFSNASVSQHYLSHVDMSLFSQALITNSLQGWYGVDVGFQLNLFFKHWFNLESTLSGGVARAWVQRKPSDEWFISYKLLKN